METNSENNNIAIHFSEDEAIVLFEWLSNFNKKEKQLIFEDQAEEKVLWDLECSLETVLSSPFSPNYTNILLEARERIRVKDSK